MWYNNLLVVILALILVGFGHPIVGVFVAILLWSYPKSKDDSTKGVTDDGIEYEVTDADD